MTVGVTHHPGSTTAARKEQGGQDPSPSPGQQKGCCPRFPGAHTLILNQRQEDRLGNESERETPDAFQPQPHYLQPGPGLCMEPPEAFHRTQVARCCPGLNPAPGTLMGMKAMPMLGESSICGVELYMWGGYFLGAFSGLSSSRTGAIHCQALVLVRHSLGRDVRYTCPHGVRKTQQ